MAESDIEKNVLRQGDIVNDVQYLGCINTNNIRFQINADGQKDGWSFRNAPIFGPAMVVSHSCELDRQNGIKITSVILCPIRDISKATASDKFDELKQTNIITDETEVSYLKYFYLQPNHLLPYHSGAVVDFSKGFSVHKNAYDDLVNKKILQLTESVAINMSLKLSLYFYRTKGQ
jgi:hypothetical protein